MTTPLPLLKKTLRAQLLAARERITPEAQKSTSVAIAKLLRENLTISGAIAGYIATRAEVDIFDLLTDLSTGLTPVGLPIVMKPEKTLKFLQWKKNDPLIHGEYNILRPAISAPEIIPDILLVPLLGFDATGTRLGYGGGYYDATVRVLKEKNKNVQMIGVAYSVQQVETIPREAHDERLDMVVTEKGMMRFL